MLQSIRDGGQGSRQPSRLFRAQQVIRICIQSLGTPSARLEASTPTSQKSLGQSPYLSGPQYPQKREPDSNAHLLAYQGLHPNAQNRACLLSGPCEHLRKDEGL